MANDIQTRMAAMLNHEVVAIFSKARSSFDPKALLGAHLDYLVDLEKQGLLLMSGPTTAPGVAPGSGISVLNISSIDRARQIWADEPFFRAGQRDADFFIWRLMEGNLGLSVSLSDGKFKLAPRATG